VRLQKQPGKKKHPLIFSLKPGKSDNAGPEKIIHESCTNIHFNKMV